MTDSHPCCRHAHRGSRHICHGAVCHAVGQIGLICGWRRHLILEGTEVVLFSLFEVLITIAACLAIWACLMGATMPEIGVSTPR